MSSHSAFTSPWRASVRARACGQAARVSERAASETFGLAVPFPSSLPPSRFLPSFLPACLLAFLSFFPSFFLLEEKVAWLWLLSPPSPSLATTSSMASLGNSLVYFRVVGRRGRFFLTKFNSPPGQSSYWIVPIPLCASIYYSSIDTAQAFQASALVSCLTVNTPT